MRTIHHMSINIEGMLRQYKRKSMAGIMEEDDGTPLTDQQARIHLHNLQVDGHKLMCISSECEGFDPFEKGCPGHPLPDSDDETGND